MTITIISFQGPQAYWQNHVFRALRKSVEVGTNLTFAGMMFYREGATTEKPYHMFPNLPGL